MKSIRFALFLAAIGAAVPLGFASLQAQTFDSVQDLNHRAIAASPRSLEAFPWLGRGSSRSVARADQALVQGALASAPRTVEEFPVLARTSIPAKAEVTPDVVLLKNRAWVASPRVQEELGAFPQWRVPAAAESFQMAPLK